MGRITYKTSRGTYTSRLKFGEVCAELAKFEDVGMTPMACAECKALGDGNRELYRAALDTFGDEAQIKMLFEEIGELMTAICQYSRGRDKRAHVAEEIADVRIMIDQMAVLFDCENEVERQRSYKLRRLKQRVEGAKGNA